LQGLLNFQSNRGLAEDGMLGAEVVDELNLMTKATSKQGREIVRDHQWLDSLPATIAGQRIYVDPFCRDDAEAAATWGPAIFLSTIIQAHGAQIALSRSVDTAPPERVRALRANRLGVDLVISLCLPKEGESGVFFFASELSKSHAGEALAQRIGERLGVAHSGRAIPILKNTRSPAIVVAIPNPDERTTSAIAQGLISLFADAHDDKAQQA
jgi:hypothetical protein